MKNRDEKFIETHKSLIEDGYEPPFDSFLIGKKCIVRTYSDGVHFGEIFKKNGCEVIIRNSRRLYYWENISKGLSLSETALYGVSDSSKICAPSPMQWCKAIGIIPCSEISIANIEAIKSYVCD